MDRQPRKILCHVLGYTGPLAQLIAGRVCQKWKLLIEDHLLRINDEPTLMDCIMHKRYYHFRKLYYETLKDYNDAGHYARIIILRNDTVLLNYFTRYAISAENINQTLIWHHWKTVQLSIQNRQKGANIDAIAEDINQTLIWSARNGYLEAVQFLVDNRANIHANDDYALQLSAKNGNLEMVQFLVHNRANIHASDDLARQWSAKNGHLEVVQYLVKNGADIQVHDGYALRLSFQNGHTNVANFLAHYHKN